jgi:hypothetical protein
MVSKGITFFYQTKKIFLFMVFQDLLEFEKINPS